MEKTITFWQAAFESQTVARGLRVAILVGLVLNAINQGDVLLSGGSPNWWKFMLTFLVPYCVSTHASASSRVEQARKGGGC